MTKVKPAPGSTPTRLVAACVRQAEIVPFAAAAPEEGARTVEISFSSEEPYRRRDMETETDFLEVLGHAPGECDLARLNSGAAPLLKDHQATLDGQIGVIERAWVDGGKGRAIVRFSDTPAAADILARVRAGDVSSVSVGYRIKKAIPAGVSSDGTPVVRVTLWAPQEISFVAVPADPTVGFGRSARDGAEFIPVQSLEKDPLPMPKDVIDTTDTTETRSDAKPAQPIDRDAIRRDAERDVAARFAEIDAIAQRFDVPSDLVVKAKRNGLSLDKFRAEVMDHMAGAEAEATRAGASMIGLTQKEVQRFSLLNLVRYMGNPSKSNAERAAFELDAARTAAEAKRSNTGLTLPPDVILDPGFAARAQSTATASAGGALVATDHLSGSFVDVLRDRLALADAGVTFLTGLQGDVDIPKQTGETTEYWLGEGEDGTESEITVGTIAMVPHTVAIATPITRRMLLQSTPGIEALVRNDMVNRIARAIHKAALPGHASPNAPTSVRAQIVGSAATWITSGAPTFEELVALETAVASANADVDNMRYIYNAVTSGKLKTTKIDAGSGQFVEHMGEVNGYARSRSNQVDDFEVFFGDFSKVVIGLWSGLDLSVDTATLAASGGMVLRGFQDLDVALTQAAAIALATN